MQRKLMTHPPSKTEASLSILERQQLKDSLEVRTHMYWLISSAYNNRLTGTNISVSTGIDLLRLIIKYEKDSSHLFNLTQKIMLKIVYRR